MKNNKEYFLGLDLGTTSIGWAVFSKSIDKQGKTIGTLEDLGVRIFPEPINPKNGETFTEFRRKHRGTKRLLRRKKHRTERLINLLDNIKFINKHYLKDFLTILRLSETKLKEFHDCCPQWIVNKRGERGQSEDCCLENYNIADPRCKNKNTIDFYTLAKNAEYNKIDPRFLSYVLIYLTRHRGYYSQSTDDENWFESQKPPEERKSFSSFTELYDLIKKIQYPNPIRNKEKEEHFVAYNYLKKEIISFKYIKEIIHINSLLKKNSKERIISLIKGDIKELKKKELKIIKKLSFFNGNKKLLNFILDFYDFHAQTNVIHKSKTIQLKIEDKLELPSDLKKEDSKKSWYIKRKNSGFEIIEEDNSEKDWKYSQKMLINRIDLKKSVEKILEEQAKYYDPLKKPEDKKRILDIIFGQRTSEDGPGIREYVKNEKKIYSGYNIKTLLKTGKRSEDGSLVGFRSSLIGDLYNACCEVSKLKFSNNTSKKEFYKFFLKAYLNPDSGYYVKTPSKTLSNFEIYSFDFKEFIKQNNNNSITNIETKIVEKDSVKSKGLVEYINESIKITFLNLIFNINKHNNNNKKNLKKVSSKQIFSETKNACFYISVILHEFYTPQKIFNIFMNNKELEKREKTLYKKIKDSLELNIVKNMLFKNKTEVERLKNIIFLKDILKPRIGMCNKSFKEMQDNINEFIEGKSVYDGYYNNKQIFSQFEKKPLIIVSQNKQKIQEELIIQDKYRKLNNAFFKKNKMHVIEEREEIKIEIIKTSEWYTFKFKKIHLEDNTPKKVKLGVINDPSVKTNRTVYRALSQTRKVLNALLSEYKFKNINIELARDFCLGKKKKKKLEDRQNEYRKKNEEAIAEGFSSKRLQKKFRIWKEQNGKCYLCFEETSVSEGEIDHIIPQSIISDDSYNNLAWSCTDCNGRKGKQLPKQYIKKRNKVELKEWVKKIRELFASRRKKLIYLMAESKEDSCIKDYNPTRRLNDTRYIARFFYNYLIKNIGSKTNFQTKFNCIKGNITSLYRKKWLWYCEDQHRSAWGYEDKQEIKKITDFNHAVDAVILCSLGTPLQCKLIEAGYRYWRWERENKENKKKPSEEEINNMLEVIQKDYSLEHIGDLKYKINEWKKVNPYFMSSSDLRDQLEKRIPVKLKKIKQSPSKDTKDKVEWKIEFGEIVPEEKYPKEWKYPYISRMVIRKVKRGSFGSQEPKSKDKKKLLITDPDNHNNCWEVDKNWAYYYDRNKKKSFFLKNYEIQKKNNYKKIKNDNWNLNIRGVDGNIKIQKKNILFINELLEFKDNDNLPSYYVFFSGSTSNNVYLHLNQLTKKKQNTLGMVFDGKKLVEKKSNSFNFKKLSENSKKINISILGHK